MCVLYSCTPWSLIFYRWMLFSSSLRWCWLFKWLHTHRCTQSNTHTQAQTKNIGQYALYNNIHNSCIRNADGMCSVCNVQCPGFSLLCGHESKDFTSCPTSNIIHLHHSLISSRPSWLFVVLLSVCCLSVTVPIYFFFVLFCFVLFLLRCLSLACSLTP